MAPNGIAQNLLVERVLRDSPSTVPSYWEAHGTGTPLGDPIEINVLARLLGTAVVGSNKASIGHGEACAGINGVLKVLAQSQHGYIPNTLHMHCLNPDIDPKKLGFPIIGHEWEDERTIAGVSSFGVAGTNSAVLIYKSPKYTDNGKKKKAIHRAYAIPVSAKNTKSLEMQLHKFEKFLRETHYRLSDVAATAACKREHYAQRTVLICDGMGAVQKKIVKIQAKPQPIRLTFGAHSIGDNSLQLMAFPVFADAFNKTRKELDITGASLYALAHLLKTTLPAATLIAADAHGQAAIDLVEGKITVDKAAGALRGSAGAATSSAAPFNSIHDFYEWAGQVFADGHNIQWNALYEPVEEQLLLPTYAFNHTSHWLGKRVEDSVFEDEHLGVRTVEGETTRFDNNLSLLRHRQLFRLDQTTLALYLLQKSVRLSVAHDKSFSLSAFKTTDIVVEDNIWMKTVVDASSGTVTLSYGDKEAASARFVVDVPAVMALHLPAASTSPLYLPSVSTAHLVGDGKRVDVIGALIKDPFLPVVAVVKNLTGKVNETTTIAFYPFHAVTFPINIGTDTSKGVVQAQANGVVIIELSEGVANTKKVEKKDVVVASSDNAIAEPQAKKPKASASGSDSINHSIKRILGDILTNDEPLDEEELAGGFTEMGLDSLSLMDFVNALNFEYADLAMSSTDLFDNPTIDELAAFITRRIGESSEAKDTDNDTPEAPALTKAESGNLSSLKETIKTILGDILTNDEPLNEEELEGGFTEMGLDSLSLMDFVNALNVKFGDLALSSTDLFDHPTINELAGLINERLGGSTNAAEEDQVTPKNTNPVSTASTSAGNQELRSKIIEILGGILINDDPLEPEELEGGFTEMGLDSLSLMDFVNALNIEFDGLSLSSTDLFDHPTLSELTVFIAEKNGGGDKIAAPVASTPSSTTSASDVADVRSLPDAFMRHEVVDWTIDTDFSMVIDAGKIAFKKGSSIVLPLDIGDTAKISVDLNDVLSDAELFSQFLTFAKAIVKKKGPFTFAVSPRETRSNATARAFFKTITAEKFPKVNICSFLLLEL